MTAPRSLIVADAVDRLRQINLSGETELMPSGDPVSFPALHVFDSGHQTEQSEPGVNRYSMPLEIEGYVEVAGGAAAHASMIRLYTDAVAALLAHPPLGGIAETVDEGDLNIVVATLAERRRLGFTLTILITFPARRGDPAQLA